LSFSSAAPLDTVPPNVTLAEVTGRTDLTIHLTVAINEPGFFAVIVADPSYPQPSIAQVCLAAVPL